MNVRKEKNLAALPFLRARFFVPGRTLTVVVTVEAEISTGDNWRLDLDGKHIKFISSDDICDELSLSGYLAGTSSRAYCQASEVRSPM
ncbi:hypothetical protein RUM44_011861 [Polyplax serrata]|uniref:Uncharacterized protein n=1 Tax=Polyplax serrata TaxID=468196 RepID=A0ABR1BE45_POLSC